MGAERTTPARYHVAIADSIDVTIAQCRAIYVGGAGDVALDDVDGTEVVYKGAPAGLIIPIEAIRKDGANTTATDLVAMY